MMPYAKPKPSIITADQWMEIIHSLSREPEPPIELPLNWQRLAITTDQWRHICRSDCNGDFMKFAEKVLRNQNGYHRRGAARALDLGNLAAVLEAMLHEGQTASPGTDCPPTMGLAAMIQLKLSGYFRPYKLNWKAKSTTWAAQRNAERKLDQSRLAAALTAMFLEGQTAQARQLTQAEHAAQAQADRRAAQDARLAREWRAAQAAAGSLVPQS